MILTVKSFILSEKIIVLYSADVGQKPEKNCLEFAHSFWNTAHPMDIVHVHV